MQTWKEMKRYHLVNLHPAETSHAPDWLCVQELYLQWGKWENGINAMLLNFKLFNKSSPYHKFKSNNTNLDELSR